MVLMWHGFWNFTSVNWVQLSKAPQPNVVTVEGISTLFRPLAANTLP